MNTTLYAIIAILMILPPTTQLEWNGKKITPIELIKKIQPIEEPTKVEKKLKYRIYPAKVEHRINTHSFSITNS